MSEDNQKLFEFLMSECLFFGVAMTKHGWVTRLGLKDCSAETIVRAMQLAHAYSNGHDLRFMGTFGRN